MLFGKNVGATLASKHKKRIISKARLAFLGPYLMHILVGFLCSINTHRNHILLLKSSSPKTDLLLKFSPTTCKVFKFCIFNLFFTIIKLW